MEECKSIEAENMKKNNYSIYAVGLRANILASADFDKDKYRQESIFEAQSDSESNENTRRKVNQVNYETGSCGKGQIQGAEGVQVYEDQSNVEFEKLAQ